MENRDSFLNNEENEFIFIPDYPNQKLTDDLIKYKNWKNNLYSKYHDGEIHRCNNQKCKALIFDTNKKDKKAIRCQNCNNIICLLCNKVINNINDACCIKKIFYNLKNIGISYFNERVVDHKFEEYYKIRKTFLYPYLNLVYLGIRIFNGLFFGTFRPNTHNANKNTIKDCYKYILYGIFYCFYYTIVLFTYLFLSLPYFIKYYFIVLLFVFLPDPFFHYKVPKCWNHYYLKAIFGVYAQCYKISAGSIDRHLPYY